MLLRIKKKYFIQSSNEKVNSWLLGVCTADNSEISGKKGWGVEDDVFMFYNSFSLLRSWQRSAFLIASVRKDSNSTVLSTTILPGFAYTIAFFIFFFCFLITLFTNDHNLNYSVTTMLFILSLIFIVLFCITAIRLNRKFEKLITKTFA